MLRGSFFSYGRASNLKIDGTHHTANNVDHLLNRGNVPWGALLNSSQDLGKHCCNCKMVWIKSPHMIADPHNDGHDHEGFLVTTRPVKKDEELLWSYSVSQNHRSVAPIAVPQTPLECKCTTTCVGACINTPLPDGAKRERKPKPFL